MGAPIIAQGNRRFTRDHTHAITRHVSAPDNAMSRDNRISHDGEPGTGTWNRGSAAESGRGRADPSRDTSNCWAMNPRRNVPSYSAAGTGSTRRFSADSARYSTCQSDGPFEGETCTAVTLYSGQFVAQSE